MREYLKLKEQQKILKQQRKIMTFMMDLFRRKFKGCEIFMKRYKES